MPALQEDPIQQIKDHIAAHSGDKKTSHEQGLQTVLRQFDDFAALYTQEIPPEQGAIMLALRAAQTQMNTFLAEIGMPDARSVTATVVGKYMQDVSQHAPEMGKQGGMSRA